MSNKLIELERARADPKYAPLIALIKDVVQECLSDLRSSELKTKKKKSTVVDDDEDDDEVDDDDGDDAGEVEKKKEKSARYWVI